MSAPEIRIDQLTGLRTILAPGRAERPEGFHAPAGEDKGPAECPFCEGHEERTPPEVYAVRPGGGEADTPGWTSRVVPNLYPALGEGDEGSTGRFSTYIEGNRPVGEQRRGGTEAQVGAFAGAGDPLLASRRAGEADLFATRPAGGAHEVIVNAPEHVTAMAELDEDRFAGAIATWRERMRANSASSYVQVVVNEGAGAGASLPHTHAQLYALPFVPVAVARERERFGAYRERTGGSSLLTDILVEEVRRRERLVAIDEEAALICPWASRSPFELRVLPRTESACFEDDTTGAAMLHTALRLLAERFGGAPELNLWVRTAPGGAEHFHWHIDIVPRLSIRASFELGTGVDINIYPPERAAADLRDCL